MALRVHESSCGCIGMPMPTWESSIEKLFSALEVGVEEARRI